MEKQNVLTKILAVVGSVLVWFPILAPLVLGAMSFLAERRFRLDYLMPAELFLFALTGSGLLLWGALRAHAHLKRILWGLVISILMLFGGQWLAVITGLASGETEPTGWRWGLVLASLAIYVLGLMIMGSGGVLLMRDLFKTGSHTP